MHPWAALFLGVVLGVTFSQLIISLLSAKGRRLRGVPPSLQLGLQPAASQSAHSTAPSISEELGLQGIQECLEMLRSIRQNQLDGINAVGQLHDKIGFVENSLAELSRRIAEHESAISGHQAGIEASLVGLNSSIKLIDGAIASSNPVIADQSLDSGENLGLSSINASFEHLERRLTALLDRIDALDERVSMMTVRVAEVNDGISGLSDQIDEFCDAGHDDAADIDHDLAKKVSALLKGARAFRLSQEADERRITAARVYNAIRSRLAYAQSAGKQGRELLEALLDAAISAYGSSKTTSDAVVSESPAGTNTSRSQPHRSELESLIDLHGPEWWRYS